MVTYKPSEIEKKVLGIAVAGFLLSTVFFQDLTVKLFVLCAAPWLFFLWYDFSRPEGVLTFFLYLYSFSYPVFLFLTGNNYFLSELIETSSLSLSGFILGFSLFPLVGVVKMKETTRIEKTSFYNFIGRVSVFVTPLLLLFCCVAVYKLGLSSKREINDSGGSVAVAKELLYVLFMCASFYLCFKMKHGKDFKLLFFYFATLSLVALLVLGERDIFFRFCFVVVLFYFSCLAGFKKKYYVMSFFIILFVLSFSQQIKSVLVTGSMHSATYSGWEWMFYNEFASGSRNLRQLMLSGGYYDTPNLIWMDFVRFLDVFGLVDNAQSSTAWFNSVYRNYAGVAGNSGWGFGIVPELYAVSGNLAVFGGFFALSFLSSFLFKALEGTLTGRVLFFFFVAALIYSFRADFANLLGLFVKWTLIPFFVIWGSYVVLAKSGGKEI